MKTGISTYYVYSEKGTVLATYKRKGCFETAMPIILADHTIQSNQRMGLRNYPHAGNTVQLDNVTQNNTQGYSSRELFRKHYELSDHLGNVRAVISDAKWSYNGIMTPHIISYTNYYPFGMAQAGRNWSSSGYRFGYQGQEKINEIYGNDNYLDYTYRGYNPRLGRFFAVDPLAAQYPFYSTYQFSGNRVIDMVELEGLEPAESGSYSGQGAIAAKLDEKKEIIKGTESQRWTWINNFWKPVDVGITNTELTTLFKGTKEGLLKTIEITLNLEGASFGINTQIELNGFIAQTAFETEFYKDLDEDVERYTLTNIRSKFRRVKDVSDDDIKNAMKAPYQLSLLLYDREDRRGDYRGRGLIHTTWFDGYQSLSAVYNKKYGTKYDFTKNPTLLSTDNLIAVRSALIYFQTHNLFTMDNYNIDKVSKTINRGDKDSFPKRKALFKEVNKVVK